MSIIEDLTAAFTDVGQAHHEAFLAVDGADPDWASWYADRLLPRLGTLLNESLSRSELVGLLLSLASEHAARGEGVPWQSFYASLAAERFVDAESESLSLYQFHGCPYCRMVRDEISKLGVKVELRDIMEEPRWRQELIAARGRGTVPVLRCEAAGGAVRWLPESRDIIKFLRRTHG